MFLEERNELKPLGPHGGGPSVLKRCPEQLTGVLCTIFNMSLNQWTVPETGKHLVLFYCPRSYK